MPTDADRLRALTEEILDLRAEIERLRRLVPRPKLDALDKARRVTATIARYRRAGLGPQEALRAAKEVLGLPASTFYRATRLARTPDTIDSRTSEDRMKLNVKDTVSNIGQGTPAPLSKYGATPRPAAPNYETPRADGGMSTGSTGGNYESYDRPTPNVTPEELK